jgi:hypothetical protein
MSKFFAKKKVKPAPLRPKPEVLQEYTQVCSAIGDRQFKKAALEKEIAGFLSRCDVLSREMDQILAKEREDAAKNPPEAADENPSK